MQFDICFDPWYKARCIAAIYCYSAKLGHVALGYICNLALRLDHHRIVLYGLNISALGDIWDALPEHAWSFNRIALHELRSLIEFIYLFSNPFVESLDFYFQALLVPARINIARMKLDKRATDRWDCPPHWCTNFCGGANACKLYKPTRPCKHVFQKREKRTRLSKMSYCKKRTTFIILMDLIFDYVIISLYIYTRYIISRYIIW